MTESQTSRSRATRACCFFVYLNRWAVTFLDLATNVPKLSVNATSLGEEIALVHVAGAVGVVSLGAQTIREASARCCIGGNFSLTFDGVFVSDIDLDDNVTTRGYNMSETLEDVISPGKINGETQGCRMMHIAATLSTRYTLVAFFVPAPNLTSR